MRFFSIKDLAFFILFFTIGLAFVYSSYNNYEQVRQPASASQIQVLKVNQDKQIILSGFQKALCKQYSQLSFNFVADGVAVAGEIPTMQIHVPCSAVKHSAVILPIAELIKNKPLSQVYNLSEAVFSFKNLPNEWPKTWVLNNLKLKKINTEAMEAVWYDRQPASAQLPVVLEFKLP